MLLEEISGPEDLRSLGPADLDRLCAEIRECLISAVSRTGGHLGPNLGVVELTVAMHRVFDSPRDAIIFDTGHQAYVHKMVTGRALRHPSPAGRDERVPVAPRVRTRPDRELARFDRAQLRARLCPGSRV